MIGTFFYATLTILVMLGILYSIVALRREKREAGLH